MCPKVKIQLNIQLCNQAKLSEIFALSGYNVKDADSPFALTVLQSVWMEISFSQKQDM